MKKQIPFLLWSMGVATAVFLFAPSPLASQQITELIVEDACPGNNLLINPSFEGAYQTYVPPPPGHPSCIWGPCMTAQMASGWTPWWRIHNDSDPEYIFKMPEYKPAEAVFTNPSRVRTGERAQQYFTFYSTHEAGFWQKTTAVPGQTYCFTVWGHSWSAQDDADAYAGPEDGQLYQKIGIDPTGGTDWRSSQIVWSDSGLGRIQYDVYGQFVVTAVAQAPTITVFTYSQPKWAVKHNDVYWDDAHLSQTTFVPQASLQLVSGTPLLLSLVGSGDGDTAVYHITTNTPLTWQATLSPSGNLLPTLNPTSGLHTTPLNITLNTQGLPLGTYQTTLTITTTPVLPGTPWQIPLKVLVLTHIHRQHLPLITTN
jgi:hypothetical protein